MDKKKRMFELVDLLNEASKAYYSTSKEIMSNFEYDQLYDELDRLEREIGVILSNSPTQRVGYEVLSELPKQVHASPMLSLDKTKDPEVLKMWLAGHDGILSWKLDGLTIVLTYENGFLVQAVTRGNGEVGEVVTNNARVFKNIPLTIPYKDSLVVRGEAIITYDDFQRINDSIVLESEKYKNPRNLCSGSVRQLNNRITKERNVRFVAFQLVDLEENYQSRHQQFEFLESLGFEVVKHVKVSTKNIIATIQSFANEIKENPYPSDGLVLAYDDLIYSRSLGRTSKFPRDSVAFKWQDELKETRIKEIEWSASRTGLINPVAIFEPIELEGTTVSRASLHNVSVLESLKIGIGDRVLVYKANMIIPQIERNLDMSNNLEIPKTCPLCKQPTIIRDDQGIRTLYCPNENCMAKHLKSFTHFVSRDALNVEGLSEATLEKLIDLGYIKEYADLFKLDRYRLRIESLEGFGKKSYANLAESIENARKASLVSVIYGLGIPNIGLANAKLIVKHFKGDFNAIRNSSVDLLIQIDGIGRVMAEGFVGWMNNPKNIEILDHLLEVLELEKYQVSNQDAIFENLTFCITGSVEHFSNRSELKEIIESRGGKVTSSVTKKTNYLINNDLMSTSSKNKKAQELNIPIINEEMFLEMLEKGM